jgi:hypothetical protein
MVGGKILVEAEGEDLQAAIQISIKRLQLKRHTGPENKQTTARTSCFEFQPLCRAAKGIECVREGGPLF